jgi:PhnB protein
MAHRQRWRSFLGRIAALQHRSPNPPATCQRRSRSVVASPALHRIDDRRKHLPRQQGGSMIPDSYQSLTPYRTVADGVVTFYEKALGAKLQLKRPDSKLGHTELEIGDGIIMLADGCDGHDASAPAHLGGSPVTLHLHLEDVDAVVGRAVPAGTKLKRAVENIFCGARASSFIDPFGHVWHVAAPIEEEPPGEINRSAAAAMSQETGP